MGDSTGRPALQAGESHHVASRRVESPERLTVSVTLRQTHQRFDDLATESQSELRDRCVLCV